jgi:glucose uptake protein GlcU
MSTRDKVVRTIIGASLITVAFLRLWAGISYSVLFSVLSPILIIAGTYHLRITRKRADAISEQMADSPLRRLWLPTRFYTGNKVFWQFRVLSVLSIIMGFATGFAAFLAHRRGL